MEGINPASIVLGPFLLGLVVSLALYGIEVAQAFVYTRKRGFNGRPWIKYLVSSLLALETLHIATMAAYIYGTLILSRGNVAAVVSNLWEPSLFPLEIITTGLTAFIAQLYFAWTVHMVIRKKWLTCVIMIVAATGLIASFWAGIAIISIPNFADWQRISPAMCLWLASALVADCISSGSLVYYLRQHTRRSASSHLVDRVISITLASGMVTSLTSLACLLTFTLNGPHLAFEAPFGKLYLNSVLSMLNSGSYENPRTETEEEDSTTGHHQLTSIQLQLDGNNSSEFQLQGT